MIVQLWSLFFPERSHSDWTSRPVRQRDGDQTSEELHPEVSRLLQVSQVKHGTDRNSEGFILWRTAQESERFICRLVESVGFNLNVLFPGRRVTWTKSSVLTVETKLWRSWRWRSARTAASRCISPKTPKCWTPKDFGWDTDLRTLNHCDHWSVLNTKTEKLWSGEVS